MANDQRRSARVSLATQPAAPLPDWQPALVMPRRSSGQQHVRAAPPQLPGAAATPPVSRQGSSSFVEWEADARRRTRRPNGRSSAVAISQQPLMVVGSKAVKIVRSAGRGHRVAVAECAVCDVPVPQIDTLRCPASAHHFCVECAGNMIAAACDAGTRATCAFCASANPSEFTFANVAALPLPNGVVTRYWMLDRRMQLVEAGGLVARCPAGCGFVAEISPDKAHQHAVTCRWCDAGTFCARCNSQPYHFGLTCAEYESAKAGMTLLMDRATGNVVALEREWKRLRAAELALAADDNVRCCPSCNAVITRVSGCSAMACGRDADAAPGSNRSGCGKGFNWNSAPRYTANIPPRPVADRGRVGVHAPGLTCAGDCGATQIQGVRFDCVNCSSRVVYCGDCFTQCYAAHAGGTHVFVAREPPAPVRLDSTARRRRRSKNDDDDNAGCCVVS